MKATGSNVLKGCGLCLAIWLAVTMLVPLVVSVPLWATGHSTAAVWVYGFGLIPSSAIGLFVICILGVWAHDQDDGPDKDTDDSERPKPPANRVEPYMSRSAN